MEMAKTFLDLRSVNLDEGMPQGRWFFCIEIHQVYREGYVPDYLIEELILKCLTNNEAS